MVRILDLNLSCSECVPRILVYLLLFLSISGCVISSEKKTIMVPMRDGIKLSTKLWLPDDGESQWPVILIRTPYGKEKHGFYGTYFSEKGYVVAIQDVRGQGGSEGVFEIWFSDKDDGYDAVEWLAGQDWCNGKIGMTGGSYNGWAQLATAVTKPPHLVTIIPIVTMGDPSIHHVYPFGVLGLTQELQIISLFNTHYGSGGEKYQLKSGWSKDLLSLPVSDLDKKLFGKENPKWREHIQHKPFDPYWKKVDVIDELKNVSIPVYIIGGWFDFGGIGTKATYMSLKESGNDQLKLLIGPWMHQTIGKSTSAGYYFGEDAAVDYFNEQLKWFDYHLKGIDNGMAEDPLVKIFSVGKNVWVEGESYPVSDSKELKLYLSALAKLSTTAPKNQVEDNDTYTYDPDNPTPSIWHDNTPDHQTILDGRNDYLIFETDAFEEDKQVLGPISATIYASSSAIDTDWFVYYMLMDDADEMQALGRGLVRARYRGSKKELLIPEEIYQYEIDLWHSSFLIEKGWKMRVLICSSAFPHYARNLNTGGDNETETQYIKADQKIYHSKEYPSHIRFTVIE